MMEITRTSMLTNKQHTMVLDCTPEQFAVWKSGVYLQDAFSNLLPEEREFIKSGITPEEWQQFFG